MPLLQNALSSALSIVSPAWVLAVIVAVLNVFVFHLVVAREGHSALYLAPFGIFGFAAGNLVAAFGSSPLPMLGDVHVLEASLGAWVCLTLANARRIA